MWSKINKMQTADDELIYHEHFFAFNRNFWNMRLTFEHKVFICTFAPSFKIHQKLKL